MHEAGPVELAAATIVASAAARGIRLALAEHGTGGIVGAELAAIDMHGHWIERALTMNSAVALQDLAGVPAALIDAYGPVSRPVALAMVEGLAAHSDATIILGATAMPGPAASGEEEGLVYIAARSRDRAESHEHHLGALDGSDFQARIAFAAFLLLETMLDDYPIGPEPGAVIELLPP